MSSNPFEKRSNVCRFLERSTFFNIFNLVIGANRSRATLAECYIKARDGEKILDMGSGTSNILHFLPRVDYIGFDSNRFYVEAAQRQHSSRGIFFYGNVKDYAVEQPASFDIVLALGVLHHLDDLEAHQLFQAARTALKKGGRMITFDGCYTDNQSPLVRWILSMDRGAYVRKKEEYIFLAKKIFPAVRSTTRHDLLWIPYTHLIMECS